MTPLLTFYGDDFTGSCSVMEVLSFAGVPTMLFLQPPSPEILENFPDLRAVGVAGIARAKDPDWMRSNLPSVMSALKALNAPVAHYKVCSTFDSSPTTGSIGVATELGLDAFASDWVPLVVGAPAIERYQVFGHLFAGVSGRVHRLDRHPVMSRHPVTPMDESDLALHLSRQTQLPCGVVNLAVMKSGTADAVLADHLAQGAKVLALDVMDDDTLAEAGRLIWQGGQHEVFAVGSQGVEYALVAHWRAAGVIPKEHTPPALRAVDQIFAVSGSCSPITAGQIARAEQSGFHVLDMDALSAVEPETLAAEFDRIEAQALALLSGGQDVLVTTARGPDDPSITLLGQRAREAGTDVGPVNDRLGAALGALVKSIRHKTGLARIAVSGGDTSGQALIALGAEALSAIAPLAAGAPLCRVHTQQDALVDGLEVTLKGGQMGQPDFFSQAKGKPLN